MVHLNAPARSPYVYALIKGIFREVSSMKLQYVLRIAVQMVDPPYVVLVLSSATCLRSTSLLVGYQMLTKSINLRSRVRCSRIGSRDLNLYTWQFVDTVQPNICRDKGTVVGNTESSQVS